MTVWNFILEALQYSKIDYQERASKYFAIPGYKEDIYYPKLKEFDDAITFVKTFSMNSLSTKDRVKVYNELRLAYDKKQPVTSLDTKGENKE